MSLDLQAISITSAFSSILNFFKSQENNSRWRDLTTGAEGIFLIRMLANIITNISYRLITARRENYLSTANLMSSVLGMAVNYGYSACRGKNQRRRIRFIPNSNYTLPKLTIIGSVDADHDIILLGKFKPKDNSKSRDEEYELGDVVLKNREPIDLVVTVGKLNEFSFTAGTNQMQQFSQYIEGISEDFNLYVDNEQVPTSSYVYDLIHNKYLVRTNPNASVDILYNNTADNATYRYGTESVIRMLYVQLDGSEIGDFDADMFSYGTMVDVLTINDFVPFESVASIKINAPLQHCTEGIVRSKVDYTSRAQELVSNVKQVEYQALTPSYTLITYLKDDYTLLTPEEKDSLNDKLIAGERLMGTLLPDITPPRRELISLNIYLELNTKFKDINDIREDINNIIASNFAVAMHQTFNVYVLERLLENLAYVFRARVSYNIKDRSNQTLYNLGDIILQNGTYYKADKILGLSGTSEPTWNVPQTTTVEVDSGLETEDGAIVWKCYKKLDVPMTEWQPRHRYGLGDYVYVESYPYYMFKCIDLKKYSGTTPPDITVVTPGDFVKDGSIVWVCKTTNVSTPERKNSELYRLGDSVNIGGATFECVSYVGTTASSTPSFEQNAYPIISTDTHTFTLVGDLTEFFIEGDRVKATTDLYDYVYIVSGAEYVTETNYTIVTVAQEINMNKEYFNLIPEHKGTTDGEIFWSIVPEDEDFNEVQYSWNTYNSFEYNLNVGGR